METDQAKQALRKVIAIRKKEHSSIELESLSKKIMTHLEQTEIFQSASCIALYHDIPGEVQTRAFIDQWYLKKDLLLPLIVGDDLKLLLYEGPDSLQVGPYGILEPKPEGKKIPDEKIDLIIVPGVAFDKQKNRMGRGKGFYDRLLSSLNVPKIGLAYQFQMVPEVPTNPFDKKMDFVITENGIL